jgi:hypothetical protein
MSVSCECCVLSRIGLCVGLITRPEKSYRVCGLSDRDREVSILNRVWPTRGYCAVGKKSIILGNIQSMKIFIARFSLSCHLQMQAYVCNKRN